jgi:hypothetical protein
MVTWALSLVPIMAMSVLILFTSHVRCWTVGSFRYLLCHLATQKACASASVSGSFGQLIRLLIVEPNYPSLEVLWTGGACESTLQGTYYLTVLCVQ